MLRIADMVKDWGGFEKLVASLHETGDVTVQHDVKLPGRSGALRQIDVLVRHRTGLYEHLIVVECKHWGRNVQRLHVDAMATACREVGASRGVIFSNKGFQRGAIEQARHENIDLFLVRDLTDAEWGLPGQLVYFYLHLIQSSAANIRFDITGTWVLSSERPSGPVNLNIVLSKDENSTKTHLVDGGRFETLEALIEDGMDRGMREALTPSYTFNGGTECDVHLMTHLRLNLDPPERIVVDGILAEVSGIDLDLGIRISQSKLAFDRSEDILFALAVEDQVRGSVSTASRSKGASVTVLQAPLTERSDDVLENGSVFQVFLKDHFDFAEFDGKTPIEVATMNSTK